MRYVFTIFFLLIFSALSIYAQNYNWVQKQSGSSLGGPIDVERDNPDNIYYGSDNKIYKSTDGGETFSQFGTNVPFASEIKNIILDDDNIGTLLVAIESSSGGDKILKSTDSGANWTITLNAATFSFFGIPMTPDPSHPDTIYTMSNADFIRSTDFGDTWSTIASNFGMATPCDIEVFKDTSVILIGDNGTGIFRSTDYGLTWSQVFNTTGEIPTVAINHLNPGVAWATKWSGGGGLLKSTDYGATWTAQPTFNGTNMWGVHVNPVFGDQVIAGCYSCGNTWMTKDDGSNWMQINIPSTNYQIYIIDSTRIFSAQGNGFYKLESPFFIPVELTSFSADVQKDKIILNWDTATELNNQGFEVERSFDNENFETLGFVPGFGSITEARHYTFEIDEVPSQTQFYRLKQIDYDGSYEYHGSIEVEGVLPTDFVLNQNYPNPFNPSTTISFSLPFDSEVKIIIYNLMGEKIKEVNNQNFSSGTHNLDIDLSSYSSGNYLYIFEAVSSDGNTFKEVRKMTLLK